MFAKSSDHASQSTHTSILVLNGTITATAVLGVLLVVFNGIVHSSWLNSNTWIITTIFCYLFSTRWLLKKECLKCANWMLIAFYILLAFCTLLTWGLNAPVGILTISFAVILPSILMGSSTIFPVGIISLVTLITVQILHENKIVTPNLQHLAFYSSFWDVATYATILTIFALVSWVSSKQREDGLLKTLIAEEKLRQQKDRLSIELEQQSSTLRLTQLNQIRHLHKFALLGQSTAATLHELSNHLSILNIDIDDLEQHHSNSNAIENAKDSIKHINKMVSQARKQLNSYDAQESFNPIQVVHQAINDMKEKFTRSHALLFQDPAPNANALIATGNPAALMQIIAILLNNALDATHNTLMPKIIIKTKNTKSLLFVSITDNGTGLTDEIRNSLFNPVRSAKKDGLGVGLYIAKHLAKDQFNGDLSISPTKEGACFVVTIPISRSSSRR